MSSVNRLLCTHTGRREAVRRVLARTMPVRGHSHAARTTKVNCAGGHAETHSFGVPQVLLLHSYWIQYSIKDQ